MLGSSFELPSILRWRFDALSDLREDIPTGSAYSRFLSTMLGSHAVD